MRRDGPGGYWVSDDRSLVDFDLVHGWISAESYWAAGRPRDVMARAMVNSIVLGLYRPDGSQAGFARMVTDCATFAWLCDVFVTEQDRADGLGSFLVEVAVGHPDVAGIRQVLATRPGRTLYRRHGYVSLLSPERWMERPAKAAPGRPPGAAVTAADPGS
jgi:GNAT superfamily N-acetyltransferase